MRRETVKREKMAAKAQEDAAKHRQARDSARGGALNTETEESKINRQLSSKSPQPLVSPRTLNRINNQSGLKQNQDIKQKRQPAAT